MTETPSVTRGWLFTFGHPADPRFMAIQAGDTAAAVRIAIDHGMDVSEDWCCRPDELGTAAHGSLGKHLTRDEAVGLALIPYETPGRGYADTYAEDWRDVVEHADGTLNMDQVMRELSDYSMLLKQVPEAYDDVTGGRISKPHTLPVHVINCVNERIEEAERRAVEDLITGIREHGEAPFATAAEVIGLIRDLTGYAADDSAEATR